MRRSTRLLTRAALGGALLAAAFFLVSSAFADPPPTFVVTTTADSNDGSCLPTACSLRDAINAADATTGGATIDFDIPGSGVQTISPTSDLPQVTNQVTIDGTTQPGYGGTPLIFLSGASCAGCTAQFGGLTFDDGSGSLVKGLAIGGFSGSGIDLIGNSSGTIASDTYVGIDPSGTADSNQSGGVTIDDTSGNTIDNVIAAANQGEGGPPQIGISGADASGNVVSNSRIGIGPGAAQIYDQPGDTDTGVEISNNAHDNTIGASPQDSAGGNVIALIGTGVDLEGAGSGNTIAGNRIGLDDNGGSTAMRHAVAISNTSGTIVGNANPKLGNVIGGVTGAALASGILVTGNPTGGTVIAGNFLGVGRSLQQTQPNAVGIDVSGGAGGVTIGPGNTITNSTGSASEVGDGVLVEEDADETQISKNSIYANTGQGIDLSNGANDGITAPTITSVVGNQVSGTVTGPLNDTITIEVFGNPSCDDAANGAGQDYLGFVQVTIGGSGTASWSTSVTVGNDQGVTATATNQLDDTSQFSACSTVAGELSGSLSTSLQPNADLTAAGTQDWAVWGYANNGTSTSLAPDVRKAGGSGISNLTDIHQNGAPLRGLGQFASQGDEPFGFKWSDGTVPTSATGAAGGLEHDGQPGLVGTNGDGFSFTVPADTTQRTLTVYTSAHWATGTLTATLSDGSAQPYTQTVTSSPEDNPGVGDNDPGVFTIQYAAANSGQHLTVTLVETAANCPQFGCDNAAIYAVALAGSSNGSVTSASAGLGSDPSVAMSGSVPTSDIPLAAFDPQPPGAPPITINGLQLANTQLANTQLANTQLANTQLANTQLANTQLANTQLANTQLANTQLANTQLANTQLANTQLANTQLANTQLAHTQLANTGLPLNTVPLNSTLYPDGWAGLLQGTTLGGQPLQTVTLHDALALTTADVTSPPNGETAEDVIDKIQGLSFADIALPASSLGQVTVGALALGGAEVNQLGGDLQAAIESQLQSWCQGFVADTGAPTGFCTGSDPGLGYLSLIQLGLLGAPVASLQLANTQLANTQLANTQLANTQLANTQLANTQLANTPLSASASGIVGMQLAHTDLATGFGIDDLVVGNLPSATQDALFDCSNPSNFDCETGTLAQAQAAGAIEPTTTVGDLDQGDFLDKVTIAQLLATVLGPTSAYADVVNFGDLVGLFLRNSDVQWESLSPDVLAIFDPNRPSMSMTADFSVQGSGTPAADVRLNLPAGFDYVPGSATLTENQVAGPPPGDPLIVNTASGLALDWHFDSVDTGAAYGLKFSVYGGTTVGPTQATETITAGGQSSSSVQSFSVTDSNPSNGTAANATPIDTTPGHDSVEMSTLPTAGAVDYYTFPMPAAGARISVHLTNLPADYDLALYSPRTTSVRTTSSVDPPAPPLQDGIVPDTQVNLNGGSSGPLTPTGLEDVPDPGIPLVQLSDNRHEDDEDVGMVSPGGGGSITVAVFGYNGAFSPDAYTLRVRETPPPVTQICSARSFQYANTPEAGQEIDSLSTNLASIPGNVNTLVLVNEKRLGDTYGVGAEQTAVSALDHLATGDQSLGVSGVVVPVEQISGVQALYDTWDENPCDPGSANAVANAIADEIDTIVAAHPSIKYIVFGGGDDQIPFFRLPDLSLIANESGFADQFSPNEYQGSLAAGDLLSDDPYLDTQPVPASGQQLFPPNLSGGRLVETPQEIAGAVTSFESAHGALKSSTGFVSGYDFVADGSQSVANNLTANGVNVNTLIDDPLNPPSSLFGSSDLLDAAFPPGGSGTPADINSWNGHYDNDRAQMANGDIISTSDLPSGLNGGVFFTMGCHAGFQTTDAVVGSTVLDWPQYFAEHDTGFVGNTGFGLGDTDSVAFSEQLMADFAGQVNGSNTLGQALLQAKQQYYLSRVAFSNYDEKTLSEAELYGLPMYGIGHSPTALSDPTDPPPDPVTGASASTSPSQAPLESSFAGNSNVESANFAVTPSFGTEQQGQNGDFFTNAGQVQAPNYRPLQPYVSLPAGRTDSPGLMAHGVVIDTLTSEDHTPFSPDNVRPTLNSSADEPPPSFTEESWPEKIPTLVSLGQDQNVNLATGQFFTQTSGDTTGVERLWTQIGGQVTYSTSQDFTPPTIDSINAFESDPGQSDDVLGFTGQFSDLNQNNQPGTVVFAQVVYDDGTGHWQAAQLQQDPTSGLWSAGVPFSGTQIQYFVEACDAAGNCGYSSNKGDYFDAQPLPSGTGSGGSAGTLAISPSRNPDAGAWYTGSLTVTAATTAPDATVSVTVDGHPEPTAGPITLTGDGAHIVAATDSAGNVATAAYLIDTTGPTITHTVSPAAPDGTDGWYKTKPTATFNCADNLSGVASCLAVGGTNNTKTLGDSGSSQTVNATATDNAGNHGADSVTVTKVDSTPPVTPAFHGITNGATFKPSAVPAQSAITCTSTDTLSLLASCVVTGYDAALGTHTLTATATDNAGNTATATLTYTVAKVTPTITWNPPATILFGTKLSSTQLNATAKDGTASVAGTFVYSPAVGTLLQPGSQSLSVTFTPTNTTDYTTAAASRTITVGFSQACQTGSLSGALTIKSGSAYCIQGGKVSGSITIQNGGSLYISGGSVSGSITSTGATALTLCGATVSGSMSVGTSTGLVELGGPSGGSGCAGNKLATVTLTGNKGGVIVDGNTISGPVTASSNTAGLDLSGNKVSGAITVNGNSGGVKFTNNNVSGNVTITNNTGGFMNTGNVISGTLTLKNNN